MNQTRQQGHFRDIVICTGLAAAVVLLAVHPSQATAAAADALGLCCRVIIPSLFPYFVLTGMLTHGALPQVLSRLARPVMGPLFGVGGAGAAPLVLGLVGGYPVGARTVAELYDSGSVTKAEAEKLLAFCNNSGPAFIFGVAGAAVLESGRLALIVYLSHIAGAVCTGLLLRGRRADCTLSAPAPSRTCVQGSFSERFVAAVTGSFTAVLNVCAFILFFAVAVKMTTLFFPADSPACTWLLRLYTGAMELSSGIWSLKGAGISCPLLAAAAALMLGWGGLSVHCQTLALTAGRGLRMRRYFCGKLLHGLLSSLFAGAAALLSAPFLQPARDTAALPVWICQAHAVTPLLPALSAGFLWAAAQLLLSAKNIVEKRKR